ncbi:MAG: hypothetical protein FJ135_15410 [Deltaproteobacteria bacterium]|nr:hypothetical protein [Deltaproteobacteria bacterium]
MPDPQSPPGASYSERLQKLIPTEVIAAYLAIHNVINSVDLDDGRKIFLHALSALILLILQPFYQYKILQRTYPPLIIVSCISFVIWAVSVGGIMEGFEFYLPIYSTIAIILWTFVIPMLVGVE